MSAAAVGAAGAWNLFDAAALLPPKVKVAAPAGGAGGSCALGGAVDAEAPKAKGMLPAGSLCDCGAAAANAEGCAGRLAAVPPPLLLGTVPPKRKGAGSGSLVELVGAGGCNVPGAAAGAPNMKGGGSVSEGAELLDGWAAPSFMLSLAKRSCCSCRLDRPDVLAACC
jgi:hypothetical protein